MTVVSVASGRSRPRTATLVGAGLGADLVAATVASVWPTTGLQGMGSMGAGSMGALPTMTGPMWMSAAPPTFARLFAWHPQPVPVELFGCVLAALAYGGVLRLHHRGVHWLLLRSGVFGLGLVSIVGVTATGIGAYGMAMFSVHMAQHMTLSMFTPSLLLLGAPVTLALRTLPVRPRKLLLTVLHSRVVAVLSSPLVSLPLFVVSLYGLYFTPLFDLAMRSWWGHEWMLAHFLAVGLLFFWPLVGVDPAPHPAPHLMRMLELLIGVPFHAFFGTALMSATVPMVHFFTGFPASWHTSVLHDQYVAGGVAWGTGEVPSFLVMMAIFVSWARSDERRARQLDRQAHRDGDAALAAYDDYLARLATGGPRPVVDEVAADAKKATTWSGYSSTRSTTGTSASAACPARREQWNEIHR